MAVPTHVQNGPPGEQTHRSTIKSQKTCANRRQRRSKEWAMRRTTVVLLAALLSTAALPALAAWDRIGSLEIGAGKTQEFSMENFKGNVIGVTARESDVMWGTGVGGFVSRD